MYTSGVKKVVMPIIYGYVYSMKQNSKTFEKFKEFRSNIE